MKKTLSLAGLFVALLLIASETLQAKDERVRLSYPSKVESSKGKEREKLFTPWMSNDALRTQVEEKRTKGEQIIYFEYNSATTEARAIYVNKLKLSGPYSRWYMSTEQAMEDKLNNEMKSGLQPAFIVRNISGTYIMLFVSPGDLEAVRAQLKELGIGEPRLKK
ncbi:hypothetical protein [Prosthecobacter vanneervenii]|uniref:SPOR domain-containing protein n=1 Tax=Prosthecobacter vanneervenii TaxID=48466 RepID=A0A7W7Y733_9BACT|nr:hypothetical protein [Prosthecobacter vanneervenii]MBB5030834.1 hypothetical protein [Prosthecobacter vanneervenii]